MLENLSNNNEHAESLFVQVIWEKCKNVIFACIYRPAKGNHSIFLGKTKYKEANLFNLVFQIGLCSLIDWPKSNNWNWNWPHTYKHYISGIDK